MAKLLLELEEHTGLTAAQAAKLLGYARVSYYQIRRKGSIPAPTERLIEVFMTMPRKLLNQYIKEYVHGERDDEL